VKELIALAKARPGAINYAAGTIGGSDHLATELFLHMAGINIVHVPYKGSGPATTDLIGGHVALQFGGISALRPHAQAGKLRMLAVSSAKRSPVFPICLRWRPRACPGYEAVQILGFCTR
jgi:tripartite-type tricarboxylate transporter receptor subunit TctC